LHHEVPAIVAVFTAIDDAVAGLGSVIVGESGEQVRRAAAIHARDSRRRAIGSTRCRGFHCHIIAPVNEELRIARNPLARVAYAVLGFVFLGIGIFGFIVPGPPGTVFLLVALYFFSMSNERMYRWMLTNKYFGQVLLDYHSGLGIPRRIKFIAVASIVLAVAYSAGFVIDPLWVRLLVVTVGAYGVWFVISRPTTEIERARRAEALAG